MKTLARAACLLAAMTVLTGIAYPLVVTGIASVLFPRQAGGSLVEQGGVSVGSDLIGQPFSDPRYFWGRPSATGPSPYNAAASGGSNLGPTNAELLEAVRERALVLRAADPGNPALLPGDLVTASGSGLDPDISPAAAYWQVSRVARARGLPETTVRDLVKTHVQSRQFGILGEPRVNVLLLNLALDERGGR